MSTIKSIEVATTIISHTHTHTAIERCKLFYSGRDSPAYDYSSKCPVGVH